MRRNYSDATIFSHSPVCIWRENAVLNDEIAAREKCPDGVSSSDQFGADLLARKWIRSERGRLFNEVRCFIFKKSSRSFRKIDFTRLKNVN